MIPKNFNKIWKIGLESENYFLKLCGSGGGGYIIGFSVNLQMAKEQLSTFNFQEILSY
jgi:mevalonate kinase